MTILQPEDRERLRNIFLVITPIDNSVCVKSMDQRSDGVGTVG